MSVERRTGKAGLIIPFAIFGVLLAAWTVWWFVAARQVEARVEAGAAELRKAGYDVHWNELDVSGWPFRTFVRMEGVRLGAPSGHALAAPRLHAEANTYELTRWVLAAPDGLTLTRADKGDVRITGQAVRASVAGVTKTPPRLVVELLKPTFTPAPGAEPFPLASAEKIDFYLRPRAGEANAGETLFRIVEGRPRPGGVLGGVMGERAFSSQWEGVISHADRFDGPTWSQALRGWSAAGGGLTLLKSETTAGDAKAMAASDRLGVGPDGRLQGVLTLELQNGAGALAALGRAPKVDPGAAAAAGATAATQGALTGETRLSLVFEDGQTRIGPFRLAPAPKVF